MISPPLLIEWKNGGQPLEFDPMRFSPDRAEHKRHGFSYIPFGGAYKHRDAFCYDERETLSI